MSLLNSILNVLDLFSGSSEKPEEKEESKKNIEDIKDPNELEDLLLKSNNIQEANEIYSRIKSVVAFDTGNVNEFLAESLYWSLGKRETNLSEDDLRKIKLKIVNELQPKEQNLVDWMVYQEGDKDPEVKKALIAKWTDKKELEHFIEVRKGIFSDDVIEAAKSRINEL